MGTFGPGEILFLFRLGDGFEADGTDRFNVSVGVQTANEGPLPQWRGNHGNLLNDKLGCRKGHVARPDAFFLRSAGATGWSLTPGLPLLRNSMPARSIVEIT